MELQVQPHQVLQRANTETAREKRTGHTGWGSSGDHFTRHDREEKAKQKKQAQIMLKTWELVAQKEKEEKEAKLKHRLVLQRQLINKCEEYIAEKEKIELQRKAKKQERETMKRKVMATSLVKKAASQRFSIPIKKRKDENFSTYKEDKTVEKLDITDPNSTDIDTASNGDCSTTNESAPARKISKEPMPTEQDRRPHLLSGSYKAPETKYVNVDALLKRPENSIAKYIGLETNGDTIKMDTLWNGLKVHSSKKLKPLGEHIQKLKSISAPSTKECMEEYEKDLPLDSFSGKPILLSTVLAKQRKMNPTKSHYLVKYNRAVAGDKSALGHRLVERMRSECNVNEMEDSSNWFTQLTPHKGYIRRPVSAPSTIAPNPASFNALKLEDVEGLSYLTEEGKVITSTRSKTNRSNSSVVNSATSKTVISKDSTIVKGESSERCQSAGSFTWQPLSVSALGDYQEVRHKVLNGHGKFSHGDVKLWKPVAPRYVF